MNKKNEDKKIYNKNKEYRKENSDKFLLFNNKISFLLGALVFYYYYFTLMIFFVFII